VPARAAPDREGSAWSLEDPDLSGRAAPKRHRRTLCTRRAHQWHRAFTAWVRQCLVPSLKAGDIVILDNLGSHKGTPARAAIRECGAHLLFLPPYSPDLNPIEMMFAKLKTLVRKAEERTVETTWRRVGDLLQLFTPQECSNYLRHAGYGAA